MANSKYLKIFLSGVLVITCTGVTSQLVHADTELTECSSSSDNNCFEAPVFDYANDDSPDFLSNESVCVRGAFGTRLGGKTLSFSLYANSCSSGIQDLQAAATPVSRDDFVKIVVRTDFKPDITRGNADFQSSEVERISDRKWITTIVARPITDFMMGLGADCQPLITDEPTIMGYTHGCPNIEANRVASGLIQSKLTVFLADWVAMEGGTDHGPPPEVKGLIMGFNGTDLVWRPDVVNGGFKFWVAGPHFYPSYVDGSMQNVENNLGFFSVFIPKAAVRLFTSLTPSKQTNPEVVQSNLEMTYQDLNGVSDNSPDTAGAMIEKCISVGGEVDLVAKKCIKNGEEISIRGISSLVSDSPSALPLSYTISEGDGGWWVRSEPFGFSAPKIVAKRRVANFSSRTLDAVQTGSRLKVTWSRATLVSGFGVINAKLYRLRFSRTSTFSSSSTEQFITNKLTKTLQNLSPGKWWISVAPILGSSGIGMGQEKKISATVR